MLSALDGAGSGGTIGPMIINTARDAADLLVPMFDSCESEKLVAAHLDSGQRLIRTVEREGEGDAVDLPIREIIADALRLGAHALIVAHNHPSGDPTPSEADLSATRRLAETADSMGLCLYDHFIVAGGDCRSLRAMGLL